MFILQYDPLPAAHSFLCHTNLGAQILIDADRPQRKVSWQDYASLIKRTAVGLRALGVAEHDGVALLSHNDIYYYELGDGVVAAGAIFGGIPTFVKQSELASCIITAQVKWLFVTVEFLDLALTTVQSLGIDKFRVIVFDPPGLEPYCGPQTPSPGDTECRWESLAESVPRQRSESSDGLPTVFKWDDWKTEGGRDFPCHSFGKTRHSRQY